MEISKLDLDKKTRDALIQVLMNPSDDTPSDDELREVFEEVTNALTAKWRLRFKGYTKSKIELAMQRAIDRGVIEFTLDSWKLKAT